MTGRTDNNFDLLRLLLASMVVLHHMDDLTDIALFNGLRQIFSGTLAVKGFFMVSGFLIFQSWERSPSWANYLEKRVRRLYPAYFTTIILATTFGALISTLHVGDYWRSSPTWKYLAANLIFANFLAEFLPGVFTKNTMQTVNGALWTIKVEVAFYLVVPFLYWFMRRFRPWIAGAAIYVAGVTWVWSFTFLRPSPSLAAQLPGQIMYFVAGALLYFYQREFVRFSKWLIPIGIIGFFINPMHQIPWMRPAAIAILVGGFVLVLPHLGYTARFGDFSYGIYIVHFPVIQAFSASGLYQTHPVAGFLATVSAIALLACASWHLVEKRFLKSSSHYLQAAKSG